MKRLTLGGLFFLLSLTAALAQNYSGPIWVEATPANSSHSAGQSVGGLLKASLAGRPGGGGLITGLGWKSVGGSTGVLVLRAWSRNPVNTTCTDNAAFVGSNTDDRYLLVGFPASITPAAPANTTGDAATYASITGMSASYRNTDSPLGNVIYVCAVTVSTDTADDNHLVRLTLSGSQF